MPCQTLAGNAFISWFIGMALIKGGKSATFRDLEGADSSLACLIGCLSGNSTDVHYVFTGTRRLIHDIRVVYSVSRVTSAFVPSAFVPFVPT